jgi:transcriptional regulator with XRE-family HTH domain
MSTKTAPAPYTAFGDFVASQRVRAGIGKQSEFAKLAGTTQQTVSRWEKGRSRPRPQDIPRVARVLNARVEDLLAIVGYGKTTSASTFDKPFPVHALAPESFERFCAHLLERLYRDRSGRVHRAGGSGHTQDGIDIMVTSAEGVHLFQCKRVSEFGPREFLESSKNRKTSARRENSCCFR